MRVYTRVSARACEVFSGDEKPKRVGKSLFFQIYIYARASPSPYAFAFLVEPFALMMSTLELEKN